MDTTKLLGKVTTNALVHSPMAQVFKVENLNYKVAGLHFQEDGVTPTRGTCELAIGSPVARCLHGFTDDLFQASTCVISADGAELTFAAEDIKEDANR